MDFRKIIWITGLSTSLLLHFSCKIELGNKSPYQTKLNSDDSIDSEDYEIFSPDTIDVNSFKIAGFDVDYAYDLGDGFKLVEGYYTPVDGKITTPDKESDWGDRLLLLDSKNEIVQRTKGMADVYLYKPYFFKKENSDQILILCELAFEYFFGADTFIYEKGTLLNIGHIDIEPFSRLQERRLLDVLKIKETKGLIEFSFQADTISYSPGSHDEILPNKNYKYIYKNGQLSFTALERNTVQNFVPENWKIIIQEKGDLNKDGLEDVALVIEEENPQNFRHNEKLGRDTLNLNLRNLMVLFKKKDASFERIVLNNSGFIPSEDDAMATCLMDPLAEGFVKIEKGLLKIQFHYWLSCGSWSVNNVIYTFRYQNSHFELIGFDHNEFHRASGDESSSSINFSTKKKSTTTGGNVFGETDLEPETRWSDIKQEELIRLEDCHRETYEKMYNFL